MVEECIDDLNDIFTSEMAVNDASLVRTYNLCPNTQFVIDTEFDGNTPLNGNQVPLLFSNPNMHVSCGFDGSRESNCTFRGGLFHASFDNSLEGPLTNLLIEGVTFTGVEGGFNIQAFGPPGDLTLRDCVFKVRGLNSDLQVADNFKNKEKLTQLCIVYLFVVCRTTR